MAQIKAGVMDIIRHPAKLLPTIILSVIWMVISYLMAMGKDTAVVKWINTLTYASGGMYGGSLGAAGGIFGKAVFAAVLNTIVLSLWAGKNPFARDANGQKRNGGRDGGHRYYSGGPEQPRYHLFHRVVYH